MHPIHPHQFSFTAEWILLMASFGYYWQLEGIQLSSFVGSMRFWLTFSDKNETLHTKEMALEST